MIGEMLLFLGAVWILISAIGVLKFRSPLLQAHAVSKALTLGIILMLLGLIVEDLGVVEGIKICCAIFFLLWTIPVASHLFARYWYKKNSETGSSV